MISEASISGVQYFAPQVQGIFSMIFWLLAWVVCVKYIGVVLPVETHTGTNIDTHVDPNRGPLNIPMMRE